MSYAVQWKPTGSTIWQTWSTHDSREAADSMAWVRIAGSMAMEWWSIRFDRATQRGGLAAGVGFGER
jgi:hypothetical protein